MSGKAKMIFNKYIFNFNFFLKTKKFKNIITEKTIDNSNLYIFYVL